MRAQGLLASNYVLFLLATIMMSTLQTSLWLQIFGYFPAPQLWVPPMVYWSLYRDMRESIAMIFLMSLALSPLTAMPFGLLLLVTLILFGIIYAFKQRIYWSGSTYFMLIAGAATICVPVLHLLASLLFEEAYIKDLAFFDWILGSLLTALSALPLYHLFSWFDKITQKELPTEAGNLAYE